MQQTPRTDLRIQWRQAIGKVAAVNAATELDRRDVSPKPYEAYRLVKNATASSRLENRALAVWVTKTEGCCWAVQMT